MPLEFHNHNPPPLWIRNQGLCWILYSKRGGTGRRVEDLKWCSYHWDSLVFINLTRSSPKLRPLELDHFLTDFFCTWMWGHAWSINACLLYLASAAISSCFICALEKSTKLPFSGNTLPFFRLWKFQIWNPLWNSIKKYPPCLWNSNSKNPPCHWNSKVTCGIHLM